MQRPGRPRRGIRAFKWGPKGLCTCVTRTPSAPRLALTCEPDSSPRDYNSERVDPFGSGFPHARSSIGQVADDARPPGTCRYANFDPRGDPGRHTPPRWKSAVPVFLRGQFFRSFGCFARRLRIFIVRGRMRAVWGGGLLCRILLEGWIFKLGFFELWSSALGHSAMLIRDCLGRGWIWL